MCVLLWGSLPTCNLICCGFILQRKHNPELVICYLELPVKRSRYDGKLARTFKIGLNPEPDKVPHAEGVKLCDPIYAQPIAGSTICMSESESSSVSESSSCFPLLKEDGALKVAMIIWPHIKRLNQKSDIRTDLVPLSA